MLAKINQSKKTCDAEFNKVIDKTIGESLAFLDKVDTELPPNSKDPLNLEKIYKTLFMFQDTGSLQDSVADVQQGFNETRAYINKIKAKREHIRCGTQCDGGCRAGSPAYFRPNSEEKPRDKVTFCPGLEGHDERILILIHECHHGGVDGSNDFAYPSERLINKLNFQRAKKNAASFHLYALAVNDPKNMKMGQEKTDINDIRNSTQKRKVDQSLAFLEHWFSLNTFDISIGIRQGKEAKAQGFYHPKKQRTARILMEHVFSKWFGMTKPPSPPNAEDIAKLQAIEERLKSMEDTFDKQLLIDETTGGSDWIELPPIHIQLNKETMDLPIPDLTIALLQELVNFIPNISAESEPLYVGAINEMRERRALDP